MTFDRRISLQKLEVLRLVVELGGLRQAAEQLHVSQPVISAHLRSLDAHVGSALFYRRGRHLALTEAGQAFHRWTLEVLSSRKSVERHLDGLATGANGAVSVAASMTVGSYLLPPVLTKFKHMRPLAGITLLISDPEAALRRVEVGTCEFAVVMTDVPIDRDLFLVETVGFDEYALVAAPGSDLPDRVSIDVLSDLPAVCPPSATAVRRLQDAALREAGVPSRPVVMELGSGEAIKRAVADGIGVALIAKRAVVEAVARGDLRHIKVDGPRLTYDVTLVQRRHAVLSPLQRQFADVVRSLFDTT